jgi:hypothetical protein
VFVLGASERDLKRFAKTKSFQYKVGGYDPKSGLFGVDEESYREWKAEDYAVRRRLKVEAAAREREELRRDSGAGRHLHHYNLASCKGLL